jgi:hypothetical protein
MPHPHPLFDSKTITALFLAMLSSGYPPGLKESRISILSKWVFS